jgi:hypothetical protein
VHRFGTRVMMLPGAVTRPGVSHMEFTWRMVGTLIWPAAVLAGLIAYRPWITEKLESLRVKAQCHLEAADY